jgi:hypothetical protein
MTGPAVPNPAAEPPAGAPAPGLAPPDSSPPDAALPDAAPSAEVPSPGFAPPDASSSGAAPSATGPSPSGLTPFDGSPGLAGPPTPNGSAPQPPQAPMPFAPMPGWSEHGWPPVQPGPRPPAPVSWRDALVALIVGLVVAALGAPLALLWTALGPHVEVVMTSGGPSLDDFNTEAFVGGDVTFGAIAAGAGILVGIVAWMLRRWRGPALLIGFTLGGIGSAWVTWKLGHQIGLSNYQDLLDTADPGQRFDQPMKLRAHGLLFLQSTIAVIVYVVNAAWSHRADLGTDPAAPQQADAAPDVSSGPSVPGVPPAAPAPPGGGTASSPPA